MTFFGWVPTVTGHLSFTSIGTGLFPTQALRRETENGFCVLQKRDLLDVLLPYAEASKVASFFREFLANRVIGISGNFWFFLSLTINPDGEEGFGKIFVLSGARNPKTSKLLRDWVSVGSPGHLSDIIPAAEENAVWVAKVRLERGGRAAIDIEKGQETEELQTLLANQSFFFLKDISHVHQHHHPTHDAITEVVPDKDTWVAETQHALYRAAIRYKRFRNEKALFRSSGILAYAKSFDRKYGGPDSPAKLFHVDELEQSLSIARDEIRHFDQKRLSVVETFRNIFFAIFGLVATTGIYARLSGEVDIEVHESLIWMAESVAEEPFLVVGVTALISTTWAMFSHRIDPADNRFVRTAVRLLQGFRLRWLLVFNVFATVLFSWLAYLLLS